MKHYMKWMATAIVAGTVALVNVKVVLDANRTTWWKQHWKPSAKTREVDRKVTIMDRESSIMNT